MCDDSGLYDAARQATDSVLGDGTYAELHKGNPDPKIQAAIKRWQEQK